jgi:hypothetical protein
MSTPWPWGAGSHASNSPPKVYMANEEGASDLKTIPSNSAGAGAVHTSGAPPSDPGTGPRRAPTSGVRGGLRSGLLATDTRQH